jgi:Ala-tRNA(Pro) deacylase
MTMTPQQKKLFDFLDALAIKHQTYHHNPVFTCDDVCTVEVPAPHTKNLFLKDDKKRLWLVSALQSTVIDLKALSKKLDAKGLRFAQPELLRECLGVEPGSVTWFALINDEQKVVNPILDAALFDADVTCFHPLKNDATTVIASHALMTFVEALLREYQIIDFKKL